MPIMPVMEAKNEGHAKNEGRGGGCLSQQNSCGSLFVIVASICMIQFNNLNSQM